MVHFLFIPYLNKTMKNFTAMQTVSNRFYQLGVLTLLGLLVLLAGCGGKMLANPPTPSQKMVMADAANRLIAAVKETHVFADQKFARANSGNVSLDECLEVLHAFKTKTGTINLSACTEEFKDAFAMWEQTCIAEWELVIKVLGDLETTKGGSLSKGQMTKSEKLNQLSLETEIRFKAVCRKLELNVTGAVGNTARPGIAPRRQLLNPHVTDVDLR